MLTPKSFKNFSVLTIAALNLFPLLCITVGLKAALSSLETVVHRKWTKVVKFAEINPEWPDHKFYGSRRAENHEPMSHKSHLHPK
jgi:hypothetical protein